MCVRQHCFLVISADWSHRSQLLGLWRVRCKTLRLHVGIYFVQKIFKLVPTFPADRLLAGGMLRGITGCERRNC